MPLETLEEIAEELRGRPRRKKKKKKKKRTLRDYLRKRTKQIDILIEEL